MNSTLNGRGLWTLFIKEVKRFLKVSVQTILAPVVTVLLYLLVFGSVLEGQVEVYRGVTYTVFLVPGLVMMSIIQNAFANSSSSIIQSKLHGDLMFVLIAPISVMEFYTAFISAAILRGTLVGLGVYIVTSWFVTVPLYSLLSIMIFTVLSSAVLGAVGIIAGIWSDKYDQLSAFQNFIILPLSFLSGVFYSINTLPPFWQTLSHFNPFFYMIDGFRYGFFGESDVSITLSITVVLTSFVLISILSLWILLKGYKIRA